MKLAEALILRADSQKRLAQLRDRLGRNALVQEGESPAEPPAGLLAEYEQVAAQWPKETTITTGIITTRRPLQLSLVAEGDRLHVPVSIAYSG